MFKRIISCILIMLLLISFTTSIGEEMVKTDFTAEELLADYDQLWEVLKESYPYLPVLEERGKDVETRRLDNRVLIGSRIKNLKSFYHYLLPDMLRGIDNLAHLHFVDAGMFKTWQSVADQYDLPEKTLYFDSQTEATYSYLGADDQPNFYERTLPIVSDYFPEAHAAYFRFPTFATTMIEIDRSQVAEALADYPHAENVIIDITGNSGGNTDYWLYTIVSAFAQKYEWNFLSYVKVTPLSAPFYLDVSLQPVAALPVGVEKPAFADALGMTHFVSTSVTYPTADYTGPQESRPLRRWLLVDQGVYSAADSFTRFCKDTGWATVVGKTTLGDGASTSPPITVRLDNTGLLLKFSVITAANADGTPNGAYGTAPDYISKPRETPLETCLRLIKNLP